MGILMDKNKKLYYDNLNLFRCKKCGNEFIMGEKSIFDENMLNCPRCHAYSVKNVAKTNDETLSELELGSCTLVYIEDKNSNDLINKLVQKGKLYDINFSIEELMKCSYENLLGMYDEFIKPLELK
ncbi:FmdB family zinc ribbon protein [Clostridium estertheticum]|uniref:FmdB family zinc ribbon protein n=1 Tax=Clostridium estertheticum TaxID=238834 RepID=UPI001C0BE872|nr:zinc ribbon domain-containing protein [Clostridium estertheticum]MBU3173335.1 zinc ribbon domain-containing protein [Clostridium estertheticum]